MMVEIFRAKGCYSECDCFKEFPGEVLGMLSCKEQEKKQNKNRMGRRGVVITGEGIL